MNPLMTSGLDPARSGATALSVNLNLVAMMRNRRAPTNATSAPPTWPISRRC
jgi:hypothetical protein